MKLPPACKTYFSYGEKTLEEVIAGLLTEKKLTIAVAESCTGGLITNRLTMYPAVQIISNAGLVTVQQHGQNSMLGVPAEVIENMEL